ncbi:MAG: lytic transglycosylase [Neobacillus sp.]|jgi:soluble lytic murein transglycosylase|nr:lytic transglycosylase [Neobacillus sp.]
MNLKKIVKWLIALVVIGTVIASFMIAVNHLYPLRYFDTIQKYAEEYHLKPELVCAVIHTESKFNKEAISPKGASGLMQITESTATWLAEELGMTDFAYDQVFDQEVNIRLGCYYLNRLENQYGNMNVALCAYNAGSGNVNNWLNNSEYSSDGKTLNRVPFSETQNYLKRVKNTQKIYAYILCIRGTYQ